MKKASKLLWVLLPLAIMAMAVLSCGEPVETPPPIPGTANNPTTITHEEWGIYYFKLVDRTRKASHRDMSGLQRIHFHLNPISDGEGGKIKQYEGVDIQQIFVSTTNPKNEIPSNAQMVVDYTATTPWTTGTTVIDAPFTEGGANPIWTATGTGTENGKISTGKLDYAPPYKYLGNVASVLFETAVYVGIVMKNVAEDATAEALNLTFLGTNLATSAEAPISFTDLFGLDYTLPEPPPEPPLPPAYVENWTAYYYEIPADAEILEFHVDTGYVEIQNIFVNNVPSQTSAKTLFDFTSATPYDSDDIWWGADTVAALISNGAYVLSSDGVYKAGGRFASAGIKDYKYIGFTIESPEAKSEAGLGDTRIRVGHGDFEEDGILKFSEMALGSELDLTEWTVAYFEIPDDISAFDFHGGAWNMGVPYIEIQKIFVNTSKSQSGATYIFDFTQNPAFTTNSDAGPLYWENLSSFVSDGKYTYSGNTDATYKHGGGFGYAYGSNTYIGFIFKTNTALSNGLGDFRMTGDTLFKDLDFEALE